MAFDSSRKYGCLTGILVDLSDTRSSNLVQDEVQTTFQSYSKEGTSSGEMCDHFLADEVFNFDMSLLHENRTTNEEADLHRFSLLSPCQVAELFEQANTVAVRLHMAASEESTARSNKEAGSPDAGGEESTVQGLQLEASSVSSVTSRVSSLEVPRASFLEIIGKTTDDEACLECDKENKSPTTKSVLFVPSGIGAKSATVDKTYAPTESRRFTIPKASIKPRVTLKRNLSSASASSCSSAVSTGCPVTTSAALCEDAGVSRGENVHTVKSKLSHSVSTKTGLKPVCMAIKNRQSLNPIFKSKRCAEVTAHPAKPRVPAKVGACTKPTPLKSACKVNSSAVNSSCGSGDKGLSLIKKISKIVVKSGIGKVGHI